MSDKQATDVVRLTDAERDEVCICRDQIGPLDSYDRAVCVKHTAVVARIVAARVAAAVGAAREAGWDAGYADAASDVEASVAAARADERERLTRALIAALDHESFLVQVFPPEPVTLTPSGFTPVIRSSTVRGILAALAQPDERDNMPVSTGGPADA